MFPPLDRYSVIKRPLIPYSNNILRKVFRLLGTDSVEVERTGLPMDLLTGFAAAGIVRISSKGVLRPLEDGRKLHQIFSKAGMGK